MALTEQARHDLISRVREVMGPESATTMMELLPPVGWADVATKHDLDLGLSNLERRIDLRFEGVEERTALRLEAAEARMSAAIANSAASQTRVLIATTITLVLATLGLAGLA